MDPNYGYQIHGLENPIVRSAEDLKKKLEYGRKSRKTQIFSTGPANDSTGAMFEIVLKQEVRLYSFPSQTNTTQNL